MLRTMRPTDYLERHYGLSRAQTVEFGQMFDRCIIGKADLREEIGYFLKEWNLKDSVSTFLNRAFEDGCNIDETVLATVQSLRSRGVKCGLVTNQDKHRMEFLDRELALRSHFDRVFVSHEIGFKKPDHAFYRAIAAQLPRARLLFWDDRIENVKAARACGWTSFHFQTAVKFADEVQSLALSH